MGLKYCKIILTFYVYHASGVLIPQNLSTAEVKPYLMYRPLFAQIDTQGAINGCSLLQIMIPALDISPSPSSCYRRKN